jgi:hypothetical protein
MNRLRDAAAGKTQIGKAGRKAEKATLKSHGASPVPNSGAGNAKGDGELPEFLMEVKSTRFQVFTLTQEMLSKLTGEAHATGVDPCLAIVFTDDNGNPVREGSWVCIPQDTFKELTDGGA